MRREGRVTMLAELIDRLERSDRLDRWGDLVRPAIEAAVGRGWRLDVLTGRWLGHPTHPAVVVAPMSCWVGAVVVDAFGGKESGPLAGKLIGAGVLAAAPAFASGSADWLSTQGAEKRVGTAHLLMNDAAVVLYLSSWMARRGERRGVGILLSSAATLCTGAAGYLGGHLAFRRGVGVDTTAFWAAAEEWTKVDLDGEPNIDEPVRGNVGAVPLVFARDRNDQVRVLEARCTHRGGPLDEGTIENDCVTCPWHGSAFSLETGTVRKGPASAPQPVYEVRECSSGDAYEVRRDEVAGLRTNPTIAVPRV